MLIQCPECTNQVSTSAAACPKCGAPVSAENRAVNTNLMTTQLTTKSLKVQTLMAVALIFLGLMILFMADNPTFAPVVLFGGLIWLIITRFRIWWHHK